MPNKSHLNNRRRNFKKTVARKGEMNFVKQLITKAVCLLLITNILTLSVPAAPPVLLNVANETYQDIRFGFYSGDWGMDLPKVLGFFVQGATSTETAPVSRIKIYPGSLTVRENDLVVLSAVAFNADDEPLNGLTFDWTMTDSEGRFEPRLLSAGNFKAETVGVLTITATTGGKQAAVTITVVPAPVEETEEQTSAKGKNAIGVNFSPSNGKKIQSSPDAETKGSETASREESGGSSNLLPSEPGWDTGNADSSNDPGNQPGNPPSGPTDNGAGSGNFQLSAPVVSLPGRGIDLALNLNYNSRLWNKSGNQLTYNIDGSFPAPGWSLGFGKMVFMGGEKGCMLIDADGTRHGYAGVPNYSSSTQAWFDGHTTDSSFIDYGCHVIYGANGSSSGWAKMANGTTVNYASYGYGDGIYPTKITDVQGNYITITYVSGRGSSIETITDTMGRVITFQYDSNNRLISISAPRMTGQGAQYGTKTTHVLIRLHYRQLALNYSFPGMNVSAGDNAPWVIDSIYYPATKTGYWFGGADSSHSDYSSYYSSYGMLTKVEEQRGMNFLFTPDEQGTIIKGEMSKLAVYNYPLTTANEADRTNGVNLSDAPTYETLTESWAGMDVAELPVTRYSINNNDFHDDGTTNSPSRTITVTQPNGAISKQYSYRTPGAWTDGLVFADETIVTSGSPPNATQTVVGSSLVSWQQGDYGVPRPSWTETRDENNHKTRTEFDYTGGRFNQVTRSCDYDDGGVKLRCTSTQYENSAAYIGQFDTNGQFIGGQHVFNLVKATGVKNPDAGETLASWTEYEYDGFGLADTPGVVQHEPSYNPNNTDTHQVCHIVCPNDCPYNRQEKSETSGEQHRCRCPETTECNDVPVFNPATNARGNITKTTVYTNAQDQTTGAIEETKHYDITGNLITASTSCCQQTSFQYTSATQYAYPTSQTRGSSDPNSPDRITTTTNYSFASGSVMGSTDADGRPSSNLYNPDTLRPTRTTTSTGAYTIYSYDDVAMIFTEEIFESGGTAAGKTVKILNGVGQTRREESVGPNNTSDFVDTKYNKFGQVWKQSRPYHAGDTLQWTETLYDQQGRTVEVIAPDDSRSKAFYNQNSAADRPDSATLAGTALPPGNTIRTVDAWGRERWGRYDQQNRLVEVAEPNPNGDGKIKTAGSFITKYRYDTLGRLTQTEQVNPITGQSSQIRKFNYDSLGRLTRQKLAEQTATLNDAGAFVGAGQTGAEWGEAFAYDNRSNLTQKTDPRGVRTNYSYYNQAISGEDPLNRIQAVTYDLSGPRLPDSSLPIHAASNITYEYITTGDKSRIKKVETAGILKEEYEYDPEGRVQDYTQTIASRETRPFKTSYEYDTLSRVTKVRYPAQYGMTGLSDPRRIVENSYDAASRLTSLKVNGVEQAGSIGYNAADQTTSIKIGIAGANQVTESYTFDEKTGLLTNQKAQNSTATLLDLSYEYDRKNSIGTGTGKTGHLSKIVDNLNQNKNREYEYDALDRLTKAKGGINNLWTQTYTYDRYGNRTNVAATGVAADNSAIPIDGIPILAYDTTSNRITTSGFQYDAAGNQIRALAADGTAWLKYEYDAANRLRIVIKDDGSNNGGGSPVQAFVYGATNARIFDYDYGTNYLTVFATLGGITLSEYTETVSGMPTWTKSYVFLGGRLLSTSTPNGNSDEITEYSHPDRMGTRIITNQQINSDGEQTTLPFGTALNAESTVTNNKRFTNYDRSTATGLDYAMNRTYDSKQGRFTQADPIGMKAINLEVPQTLNLYNYCGNDPINQTDADGLFWGAIGRFFKSVGKILSAVANAIAKVLNNKWVRLGFFVLDFILPGLGGLALQIAKWSLKIYERVSDIVGMMQLAGMAMQGKFKELGISLAVAAAIAPLTALASGIKEGMKNAIFTDHHGGYPDLASFFGTAWKGFKNGFKDGWKQFKDGFSRKGLEALIPFYGNYCGPGYPSGGDQGLSGINGFDEGGCRPHDNDMAYSKSSAFKDKPGSRLWFRIKADFRLIGRTFVYGTNVHAVDLAFGGRAGLGASYKFILIPSFLFGRIVPMTGQLVGHQTSTILQGGH